MSFRTDVLFAAIFALVVGVLIGSQAFPREKVRVHVQESVTFDWRCKCAPSCNCCKCPKEPIPRP